MAAAWGRRASARSSGCVAYGVALLKRTPSWWFVKLWGPPAALAVWPMYGVALLKHTPSWWGL